MKLINYNYGAALNSTGKPYDSTWYRGKISVSRNEWRDIQLYLFNPAVLAKLAAQRGTPSSIGIMLREDMERKTPTRDGFRVGIRTSATDAIVHHFKPTNARQYKRQNYFIEIAS